MIKRLFLFFWVAVSVQGRDDADRRPKTRRDYLVEGLETTVPAFGAFEGDFYAGTISTDPADATAKQKEGGSLMFYYFEPTAPTHDDSLVLSRLFVRGRHVF